MKKLITIICALLISSWSFSQKDEIKSLEKALKGLNFSEAKAASNAAEAVLNAMDDKTKAKFYFLKAQAFYANGAGTDSDIDTAISSFDKLKEVELAMGKLKYTDEATEIQNQMLNMFLTKANEAIQGKDYGMAASRFEKAYKMSPKDTTYLYYAASSAVNAQDYKTSLEYYLQLKNMGYTGREMRYYATNKETGVEEIFDNAILRDASVKAGQYISPKNEMAESKFAEIVKNIALIYVAEDQNEKALAAMADARVSNPDDLGLILSEANVHLKMGNRDKFKDLMEEATSKDPGNAELQYNLGVLAAEGGNPEEAKKYYQKALDLNPKYVDAQINMAVVILDGEAALVEEMNKLGNSAADNRRYDELKDKRSELYRSAVPYLQKALELKKNNIDAARTLMNIYSALGETDKFKEMRTKVEEMEANMGEN